MPNYENQDTGKPISPEFGVTNRESTSKEAETGEEGVDANISKAVTSAGTEDERVEKRKNPLFVCFWDCSAPVVSRTYRHPDLPASRRPVPARLTARAKHPEHDN